MDPVNPSDERVNSVLDQGGVRKNPLGIPRPYFADIKYLMTQTENRPRLSDEEIIDLLKNPKLFEVSERVQAHKDYWGQKEKEADKVKADKAIAKEKAEAASPGGNTPTPVTSSANPKKGTPTGNAASKALQANPDFDSGKAFEAIPGLDSDKFLKVFPKLKDGSANLSNPEFFYVGGIAPVRITDPVNAGYGADRLIAYVNSVSTGVPIGGSGSGGSGGYIAPATTYSIQQIGSKVYSVGSDGKRELTDIDPGYAKYEVDKKGDLYGFRADGTKTKLQEGWDFAKQDPSLVVQKDSRTGESFLVNTRDPSQPKQSLGKFDFATIDPERTAAESALQSRLGIAERERAGDQSAALSGRATDLSAASSARTQDITLQGQQFNNALDLQKYVNGLINNPTDFVNRGRLSAGLAPLGGGRITQADLVNAAKNAMGSQNFQTVRDAFLPAPFVTAAKTQVAPWERLIPPIIDNSPLKPTGGAVSQADFNRIQEYVRNQPAPVNPVNPNQNTWTVGQNATNPEQVLINMQKNGASISQLQAQLQSMGLMPAPAPVPTPVTSSQNTQMYASDYAPSNGPLGAPAAASAPATAQESAEYFAGRDDLSSTFGGAGPAVTSDDTYGMESLSNSTAPGDDTSFTDYAYGGATRDERFIVGDRRDGRPAGTEEMIINPTRAPIQVVPNSRLAAYYGGTMPNYFAGGTDSRLGMYPRYDKGTDAINLLSNLFGGAAEGVGDALGYGAQGVGNALGYGAQGVGAALEGLYDRTLRYPEERDRNREKANWNFFERLAWAAAQREKWEDLNPRKYPEGNTLGFGGREDKGRSLPLHHPSMRQYQLYPGEPYEGSSESWNTGRGAQDEDITLRNLLGGVGSGLGYGAQSIAGALGRLAGYAEGTDSRLGMYPRYADGVLPSVQGAPAGSLSPVTQEDLVNTAREYSPPAVSSLLGDRGAFEARMLPVQSASMRQTNNLTADEAAALGTRLALEGTSQQEYNALQKGLFGQQRTTRRGRLVV